jgi:hypothetical protein
MNNKAYIGIRLVVFVVLINLLILFSWLLGKGAIGETLKSTDKGCETCEKCKSPRFTF